MNASKAKEIISRFEKGDYDGTTAVGEAKGYLDALSGPEVKALVEALEYIEKWTNENMPLSHLHTKSEVALFQWKEAVK